MNCGPHRVRTAFSLTCQSTADREAMCRLDRVNRPYRSKGNSLNSSWIARPILPFSRIDPSRIVTTWNVGAERLFRYAEADTGASPADWIFVPEDREAGLPEKEMLQA